MTLGVALIESSRETGSRLLGRTENAEIVEMVREYLIEEQEAKLRMLDQAKGPALRCLSGEESDEPA